jgi:hypothetical protein
MIELFDADRTGGIKSSAKEFCGISKTARHFGQFTCRPIALSPTL